MKIAFYAPLKSPVHPQPSGDRLMARLLLRAIRASGRGVDLASQFRSWDGDGDAKRQLRLQQLGNGLGRRLARRYQNGDNGPGLWFTYHVYHKAPDWIGPVVSDALKIPYVIAEASYAPKQAQGPWRLGHDQCRRSIERADAVISLNNDDVPCLRSLVAPGCELVDLQPFMSMDLVDRVGGSRLAVAETWRLPISVPWLVCAAMMRTGDKLESFGRLAACLENLMHEKWHLTIIGDGDARCQVAAMFESMRPRVSMTGLLKTEAIFHILKSSDLYVWPAVNEAYGMALLEAQACGLPVVAAATGGVAQIVEHGRTGLLSAAEDPRTFSENVRRLIVDPRLRKGLGAGAAAKSRQRHHIGHATTVLNGLFTRLGS